MSAPRWRLSLILCWLVVAFAIFVMIGSLSVRSVSVLIALGVIPPAMLMWLWNDDGPLVSGRSQGYR
jgi:hypothetical protein